LSIHLSVVEEADSIPEPPHPELAAVESDMSDVKCTYDIWQRQKPEDSSFRKNKIGHNGHSSSLEYESNI